MEDKTYNGWANWKTWNVVIWLEAPSEAMYRTRLMFRDYGSLVDYMHELGVYSTYDGVDLDDPELDVSELDEFMNDFE